MGDSTTNKKKRDFITTRRRDFTTRDSTMTDFTTTSHKDFTMTSAMPDSTRETRTTGTRETAKKRMLAALNGIRTRVDDHILKNPSPPNDAQGRALSNFVTTVNPNEFFKNGGDDKKLAILLVKEIQEHLGPLHDYRNAWRQEGSNAKKAMDAVTNNLIPFMVTWVADQEFHTPNGNQDAACQKLVATRLVDEAFYEYACNTNPSFCSGDAAKQDKQAEDLGRDLADVVLKLVQKETKAK